MVRARSKRTYEHPRDYGGRSAVGFWIESGVIASFALMLIAVLLLMIVYG